jgi:SAM-dependent methyltransferase
MEPRYGRLYATAVLKPLAEQVIRLLAVAEGETTADLLCDGGALTAAMARAAGVTGWVYAIDVDAELVEAAAGEAPPGAATMVTAVSDARRVPLSDQSCDTVASLLTLGFGDAAALIAEGRRIARSVERAVFVTWDENLPPAHEVVLEQALRGAAAHSSTFLQQVLAGPPQNPDATAQTLSDVVRFDGFEHYWAAMVDSRPQLRAEIDGLAASACHAARERCRRALQRYATPDGALRIPVRAVAIRASPAASALS